MKQIGYTEDILKKALYKIRKKEGWKSIATKMITFVNNRLDDTQWLQHRTRRA